MRSLLSAETRPLLSQTAISPGLSADARRSLAVAVPAAPAPLITTLQSSAFFPTTFRAFLSAARTTTAVPCWSSCMTGIPMS